MRYLIILASFLITISGCSKMEEKKPVEKPNTETQQSPNNTMPKSSGDNKSSGQTDDRATELVKLADESLAKYASDKSENSKKDAIAKTMGAANYLTFEANLPAKEKYRPALKYYRKVLELDPDNVDAAKNKKQIEDIYESMGMPIPQ